MWKQTSVTLFCLALAGAANCAQAQTNDDAWQYSVGAAAVDQPEYPGATERRDTVVPVLEATHGPWFVGALPVHDVLIGAGGYLVQDAHWHIGLGIGGQFEKPREASDSAQLRGTGDIDSSVFGSAFANYRTDHLSLQSSVSTDLAGTGQGTRADLDLMGTIRITPQLGLAAGPGLSWSNRRDMQTFFGVDSTQSAASGLAPYSPGQGVSSIRFSLAADYAPTPHWMVIGKFVTARLQGDAADSPLVASKSQNGLFAMVLYRF